MQTSRSPAQAPALQGAGGLVKSEANAAQVVKDFLERYRAGDFGEVGHNEVHRAKDHVPECERRRWPCVRRQWPARQVEILYTGLACRMTHCLRPQGKGPAEEGWHGAVGEVRTGPGLSELLGLSSPKP